MIVRTYGRRNRGISRTYSDGLNDAVNDHNDSIDDEEDPFNFRDSLSQEGEASLHSQSQDHLFSVPFSSQDSWSASAFDFDPYSLDSSQGSLPGLPTNGNGKNGKGNGGSVRKPKRVRIEKKELEAQQPQPKSFRPSIPATSTLMEAQEFGEMMEHVDEVNFALDGLKKNQPVRIRRASLLSLLSICGTAHQRRLLRTQGMAKTIVDAVLGLSLDDSASNLAAACLLYVLTSDGQDEHLLESPSCIRFLIRLLKPILSTATEEKLPKIGSKLLALRTDILQNTKKKLDSSSAALFSKVREVLVSCKEIKSSHKDDSSMEKPELCPKWIALLTMEKSCLSTISLEETTGTVRKSGGNFKEKLRELGGLDAVFEVAMDCHSDMESWMQDGLPSTRDVKLDIDMQSLSLLLKCLKIMENATFLSNENQCHLLGMKCNIPSTGSPLSFTQLVMSVIKILSDLYLLKTSAVASTNEKSSSPVDGKGHALEFALITNSKGENDIDLFFDPIKSSSGKIFSDKSFNGSRNNQFLSFSRLDCSSSETTSASMNDICSLRTRLKSSASSSCSGTSRSLVAMHRVKNGSRKNLDIVQGFYNNEDVKSELLEESEDPFAFDEDDFGPSKWEVLYGKPTTSRTKKSGVPNRERELVDDCVAQLIMSQQESINGENNHSQEASCSSAISEESILLADCLLTAVKVLMNLTNDNPVGCQQIAACGGLEVMSSLIAGHYPSFSSSSSLSKEIKKNGSHVDMDYHLTDQELDFLVAILGLLVNLVEKDGQNRSRLASARVQLHKSEGIKEMTSKDVIPLLCSIFMANQGAGEVAQEEKCLAENDEVEAAVVQGEKEAEKMIVEAYAALLLAFLSTESKSIRDSIADCLPDHKLAVLVPVLDRFVAFHLSLNMISPETHKAVSEVIESCRIP
ncbi:wings apart-like protein 2 [Humulus lupulus]|uniref:wings apart-like protein 2 n=1 Tax=Humulus lupulus TaxID=3486 RepID=UPI002B4069AE|nr:wings apart-like protein 2 [Humulus lupulus]XP_062096626.1 wings apart-like protein 2 [Humulus lupulus]